MFTLKQLKNFTCKASKTPLCWNWHAATYPNGYGVFRLGKKLVPAHRAAYLLFKGHIPPHHVVMHTCDNKKCVNPEHLVIGTQQENVNDMIFKGRHRHGETHHNAKFSDAQISEIRRAYAMKEGNTAALAKLFGTDTSYISQVVRRKLRG